MTKIWEIQVQNPEKDNVWHTLYSYAKWDTAIKRMRIERDTYKAYRGVYRIVRVYTL